MLPVISRKISVHYSQKNPEKKLGEKTGENLIGTEGMPDFFPIHPLLITRDPVPGYTGGS
jgi:hypothetical protein